MTVQYIYKDCKVLCIAPLSAVLFGFKYRPNPTWRREIERLDRLERYAALKAAMVLDIE